MSQRKFFDADRARKLDTKCKNFIPVIPGSAKCRVCNGYHVKCYDKFYMHVCPNPFNLDLVGKANRMLLREEYLCVIEYSIRLADFDNEANWVE